MSAPTPTSGHGHTVENPPAFPLTVGVGANQWEHRHGMTLRDWFAGQAIAGIGTWMPADTPTLLAGDRGLMNRAVWAYRQADAMLEARAKGEAQ